MTDNTPSQDFSAIDAFVAKISRDGTLIYFTLLGGSSFDFGTAIAINPFGNAYVTGYTNSADFPITKGAWQTVYTSSGNEAFAVKLNPSGGIAYSTLLGGTNSAFGWGIAVNAEGEAFVTGDADSTFPITAGVVAPPPSPRTFLVRLSAAGDRPIFSALGIGGRAISLDKQANIYTAGNGIDRGDVSITPDVFQTHTAGGSCGGGAQLLTPCTHQYVCKIDSRASKLSFCTYVTGSTGENVAALAVDNNGDVYLTGSTRSTDYPVTPDAFQPTSQGLRP